MIFRPLANSQSTTGMLSLLALTGLYTHRHGK